MWNEWRANEINDENRKSNSTSTGKVSEVNFYELIESREEKKTNKNRIKLSRPKGKEKEFSFDIYGIQNSLLLLLSSDLRSK